MIGDVIFAFAAWVGLSVLAALGWAVLARRAGRRYGGRGSA